MIVIRVAANIPPAPKSVKKAIIRKSFFENKPIVFDFSAPRRESLCFESFLGNLEKVNTIKCSLRVFSKKSFCHLYR